MDDPLKLLSIVRECEFNFIGSHEKRLKNILEATLKKWEEVDFISFATAFEVQGRMVADVFNQLPAPNEDSSDACLDADTQQMLCERYSQFMDLVQYPATGKGIWPWDIRRIETPGEFGPFPPKVILLNSSDNPVSLCEKDRKEIYKFGEEGVLEFDTPPLAQLDINKNNFIEEFAQVSDQKLLIAKSWKWFAVYPCLLANEIKAIRGRQKPSTVLIYLLGTRKEFAKRPQNDYGLIVGLTAEVVHHQKLAEVVDAVTFAWNMLAVSPHILEDGLKIAHLEAGRHTVHTVRTYINVQALPIIKFIIDKYIESEPARELVMNLTNDIATLPAMMSFVSRRPLDKIDNPVDGLRAVDCSEYNLLKVVSDFFKEELEKRGLVTEISNEIVPKHYKILTSKKNQWINELYLSSALSEVVSNIEKNTLPSSKIKILFTVVQNSDNQEFLRIRVTNDIDLNKLSVYEYDQQKSPIHGLKSLEAFFEALGGHASGQLEPNSSTYTTTMDYNLTQWKKGLSALMKQETN